MEISGSLQAGNREFGLCPHFFLRTRLVLIPFAERIGDHFLLAVIDALAVEDAVGMLHVTLLDPGVHIDAHRAVLGAGQAVTALFGLGPQLQRRPASRIPQLPPDHHERRYPADSEELG